MDGMDALAVDGGDDLVEGVDPGFGRPPVEPAHPVVGQVAQPLLVAAVVPARPRNLVGPAGVCQASAQVIHLCFVNVDGERQDVLSRGHWFGGVWGIRHRATVAKASRWPRIRTGTGGTVKDVVPGDKWG